MGQRKAGKMLAPRGNAASCPPHTPAKKERGISTSHIQCLAKEKPVFGRQGAQDCGEVWLRSSLCCSGRTCHHTAPPSARVCTGSPGPSWDFKGNWCVWSESSLAQSPDRVFPPHPHPPCRLRSSPEGQVWPGLPIAQSGQWQTAAL